MALGCNQVSDISESNESESVSKIAEECYFEMVSQGDWPHLEAIYQFDSLADSEKPNYLGIPDNISNIKSFKYNNKDIKYVSPEEFINISIARDNLSENIVEVEDYSGYIFKILTNKDPEYYTILLEKYIVCDSYNDDIDSVLQSSKTVSRCTKAPVWSSVNEFIPDLTDNMFPTYLSLVKRAAFLYIRREQSPKDERQAVAGMGRLYRKEFKLDLVNPIKNYGR